MKKRLCVTVVTVIGLLFLVGMTNAFGQAEHALITGVVRDSSGAVVPGAEVAITNTATGVTVKTHTNKVGYYTVPYLVPGEYQLTVEHRGFKHAVVSGIQLTVAEAAREDVTLQIGAQTQKVSVVSRPATLQTQTSSLGQTIGTHQILSLPLLGRDPLSLTSLSPGVMPPPNAGFAGTGSAINGGRLNTTSVLYDGGDVRTSAAMNVGFPLPLEAVKEFKVITNSYSAKYGRSGGGVITIVSQSGTNHLHGSVYEFLRNNALNANDWNSNRLGLPMTAFRENQYGFSLGGPVYIPKIYNGHNKTFFFVTLDENPISQPDVFDGTVPTALERQGDFSQTFDSKGNLIKIYDPATTTAVAGQPGQWTRSQFPNNMIPANRFNPVALKALQFYPSPNAPGTTENLRLSRTRTTSQYNLDFRIDQYIGQKQRLFFRFGRDIASTDTNPLVTIAFPSDGTNGQESFLGFRRHTGALNDTLTLRSNLVAMLHANFLNTALNTNPHSLGFDISSLGFPQSVVAQAQERLFPFFSIADSSSLGAARASHFEDVEGNKEVGGALTWIKGEHTLQTGFTYMFLPLNITRGNYPAGYYNFTRGYTQGPNPAVASLDAGYGIASFLLGLPAGGQISYSPSLALSQKYYAWYLEDDWKVRPSLTLNLGVRWEYQSPWTDRFNQLAFFQPNVADPVTGTNGVLAFVAQNGNPRTQTNPQKNNWAPRVGFAWQFAKNTVMRGAYGIFYMPGNSGVGAGPGSFGTGYSVATSVFLGAPSAAPNTPSPGGSLSDPFTAGYFPHPDLSIGGGLSTYLRNTPIPRLQSWNFSLQRRLPGNFTIEASYAGSKGEDLWHNINIDAAPLSDLAMGSALNELVPNPFYGQITSGRLSAKNVRRSQLLLPYPQYTNITRSGAPVGTSNYNAFLLRAQRQFSHGLLLGASYTISKEIDNVCNRFFNNRWYGGCRIIDPQNLSLSRSIDEWDRPQILVLNYIYQLPVGQGKRWLQHGVASAVLGNWELTGITTFAKGTPLTVNGPNTSFLPGISSEAVRMESGVLTSGQQTPEQWFNTAAFAPAPPFSVGNDSRTEPNVRNPGIDTFDISLQKNVLVKERVNFQLRASFFNAFNNPALGRPFGNVQSVNFGKILSSGMPRNIQLGLRISF